MIEFNSTNDFELSNPGELLQWLTSVIEAEQKQMGEINYIFCDDSYLHKLNVEYLNHDTLTDVISFDYTSGDVISGDVYISVERVEDNAADFKTSFKDELSRVMVHGLLHYCGYKDKSEDEAKEMRAKENLYLAVR
ncbi:rRNA maturation RNase YbeY [Dokdonia sp. R86516]|uniref:rRNA maturation RNase YbeY n=1 Tax=Dokdonia sp. R86516 TaxID=3093856 RepID=UPI0037C56313